MKDNDDEKDLERFIDSKSEADDDRVEDDTEFEDNDGNDLCKRGGFLSVGVGVDVGVDVGVVNLCLGLGFGVTTRGRLGFGCRSGRGILCAFWTMGRIAVAMAVSIVVCTEFSEPCGTPSESDELGKEEEEDGGH